MTAGETDGSGAILWWDRDHLESVDDKDLASSPDKCRLEAADSFRVVAGRALALEGHRSRFERSALLRGFPDVAQLARFWTASLAVVPARGEWFPRLEAGRVGANWFLRTLLRPAPPAESTIRLATFVGHDARTAPTIKGPDIAALPALRTDALAVNADEFVFLSGGSIADGASSSILWWREGSLYMPADEVPRVEGTTASVIEELAATAGIPVERRRLPPQALAGCRVWAVNALHGVRLATHWTGGPALDASRTAVTEVADWNRRLGRLRTPLVRGPAAGFTPDRPDERSRGA